LGKRAILAARKSGWTQSLAQNRLVRGAVRRGLGAALLFALFLTAGRTAAKPRVVELPYRSVDSYLLVEVKIDGSPVKLLVDTGSNTTIVNARSFCRTELNVSRPVNRGPGIVGRALRLRVELELAHEVKFSQPISVMNLEELSKSFQIPFDGLLGQDILNHFRSVRIDYKKHVIELEE
jgi:hypothetical protein